MHSNPRATALMSGLLLAGVAPAALAGLDTFTLKHSSGPCGDFKLPTGHLLWSNLTRIRVATDATGAGIYEWFDGRGRTTNYPNAPIVMGTKFPKGYVAIAIRSDSEHGTGNRTVTVKWSTGNETIPLKVVATCEDLRNAPYRTAPTPASEQPPSAPYAPDPPLTYCKEDPVPGNADPCG